MRKEVEKDLEKVVFHSADADRIFEEFANISSDEEEKEPESRPEPVQDGRKGLGEISQNAAKGNTFVTT